MADIQAIQQFEAVLGSWRVNELHQLLTHFKTNKLGKKQELYQRAVALLRDRNRQHEVMQKIREISHRQHGHSNTVRQSPYQIPAQQQQRDDILHQSASLMQRLGYAQVGGLPTMGYQQAVNSLNMPGPRMSGGMERNEDVLTEDDKARFRNITVRNPRRVMSEEDEIGLNESDEQVEPDNCPYRNVTMRNARRSKNEDVDVDEPADEWVECEQDPSLANVNTYMHVTVRKDTQRNMNKVDVYNMNPVRGLRMVPLPFYDHVRTVMDAMELPATHMGIKQQQRMTFNIAIPRELASKLMYRSDTQPMPRHEIQLRFFYLGPGWQQTEQADDFPLNAVVKLDEQNVTLPNVIPTNKPNAEPKRPSRHVNLTPYCQPPRDAQRPHRLTVEWTGDKRQWACTVTIVNRVNSEMLKDRLVHNAGAQLSEEATKTTIIRRLGDGDEDGITMDSLRVSLLCPLGKTRMGIATRNRDCSHLQCFDLQQYLEMNEKRPTWKCAVCSSPAPYNKLIVDGYYQRMLSEIPKEASDVELLKDGGFRPIQEAEVCSLSSDDEDDKPAPSTSSGAAAAAPKPKPPAKKPEDDIITLSDSDDDDVQAAVKASLSSVGLGGPSKMEVASNPPSVSSAAPSSAAAAPGPQSPHSDKSDDSIICIDLTSPVRPAPRKESAQTAPAAAAAAKVATPPVLPPQPPNLVAAIQDATQIGVPVSQFSAAQQNVYQQHATWRGEQNQANAYMAHIARNGAFSYAQPPPNQAHLLSNFMHMMQQQSQAAPPPNQSAFGYNFQQQR